jgi:hypothetical protein
MPKINTNKKHQLPVYTSSIADFLCHKLSEIYGRDNIDPGLGDRLQKAIEPNHKFAVDQNPEVFKDA